MRRLFHILLCFTTASAAAGCDDASNTGTQREAGEGGAHRPFTRPAHWTAVRGASDPFDGSVDGAVPCEATEYGPEPDHEAPTHFELLTETCNYATFVQQAGHALSKGDELELTLWHNTLQAVDPATGVVVVLIEEQEIARWDVPVPSSASVLTQLWQADHPVSTGSAVYLHIHNHGSNAWRIGPWQRL